MTKEDIISAGAVVYKKPTLMNDNPMHYCPGCEWRTKLLVFHP